MSPSSFPVLLTHLLFISTAILPYARAANDWSKPCLSGTCSYDLPDSAYPASGTIQIWGSDSAITDITSAAGWTILGCESNKTVQDVRLVCSAANKSDDDSDMTPDCAHLYKNGDPVGKVARLPEECGRGPFALISRSWVPDDQSVPTHLRKRDGKQPAVKALMLDTEFGVRKGDSQTQAQVMAKVQNWEPVNFALVGATVPGAAASGNLISTGSSTGKREIQSRIIGRGHHVYSKRGIGDFVGDAIDGVRNLNDFDVSKPQVALAPLNITKPGISLVDETLKCPPITAKASITVDANAGALVNLGIAAKGTVVPPKFTELAITGSLSADVDSVLKMSAGLIGTLDSGKIKIFEVGVPGLDFPGVFSIGPTFQVNAQAKASLELDVDMKVGINYHVRDARFVFPPGDGKANSGGSFLPGDTPLKLSVSPSEKAKGTLEAHLIPSLNLGLDAIAGTVKAGVFVELDTAATMSLTVAAKQAKSDVTVGTRDVQPGEDSRFGLRSFMDGAVHIGREAVERLKSVSLSSPFSEPRAARAVDDSAVGGCFDVGTGLSVNVGADANFFQLFNPSTKVPLFSKNFELFKKCFGDAAGVGLARRTTMLAERALVCNGVNVTKAVSLVDGLVTASKIR